jgi:hypothetical protein
MTTDAIVAIKFQYLPCGESFYWQGMSFTKVNDREEYNCKSIGDYCTFPPDCLIDMPYSRVVEILGEPTEPGVWE